MINIPYNSRNADILYNEINEDVKSKIDYVIKNGTKIKGIEYNPTDEEKAFLTRIKKYYLKFLITSKPSNHFRIINIFKSYDVNIIDPTNRLNRLLYSVFISGGYDKIKKNNFISMINIDTCPYCNRSYIYKVGKNGQVKPEIDHFFPKSIYPFFGVSYYNLIPSCPTCNGNQVKGDKDPLVEKLVNPYLISDNDFKFDYTLKDAVNVEIQLVKKIVGNNNVFKLEELFKKHNDHISELVIKSEVEYHKTYREQLNLYDDFDFSNEEIDRMIVGNYTGINELHKRPLSKLYRDIAIKLDLIDG